MSEAFLKQVIDTPPECTEANADYWYADPDDEDEKFGKSEQAIAKGICNRCPLKHSCLQTALESDERFGIWGGLLPREREAYKQRMKQGGFDYR